jgi:hypothetical protein
VDILHDSGGSVCNRRLVAGCLSLWSDLLSSAQKSLLAAATVTKSIYTNVNMYLHTSIREIDLFITMLPLDSPNYEKTKLRGNL